MNPPIEPGKELIEKLSEEFHDVYVAEVARQNKPLRHAIKYADLPEDIKNYDRALARYVLRQPTRDQELIAELVGELKRCRNWVKTLEDDRFKSIKTCKFESLKEALEFDFQMFRATRYDIEKVLSRAEKRLGEKP